MVELILVQLFFLILLAQVAAYVCKKIKVPPVVGEILMGIIIANLFISGYSLFTILDLSNTNSIPVFNVFSELGVIFLLFTVGLVTPFHELRQVGRTASLVAVLGVIIPFFSGLALMFLFGRTTLEALFIGAAMVATSVGITARVLKDLGVMESIEGRVIIGAAVIDDVLGLIVLAMISGIAQGGTLNLADIAVVAALAVAFVLVVIYISALLPKVRTSSPVMNVLKKRKPRKAWSPLPLALLVCFGLSALASYLNLAAIVGAFLAGMLFAEFRDVWQSEEKFGPINELFVPFFFLFIGIQVKLGEFANTAIIVLMLAVILVAIITKFVGCGLGARKLGARSAAVVGVGMIPRGEVGIIVASIGLSSGVIGNDLFTVVVAMSLVTTLLAPWLVTYAFNRKNRPKKMKGVDLRQL
ncbi:MAG: cation:proton antiporter [Methanomassiliicoccales archaeon]|nr:cation:proton antiporter [Methanomassiliicoccales archaeon]